VESWLLQHATAVPFDRVDDVGTLANFNTLAELEG
jgi:hypothetical protein